jgi:hypothetical protein
MIKGLVIVQRGHRLEEVEPAQFNKATMQKPVG